MDLKTFTCQNAEWLGKNNNNNEKRGGMESIQNNDHPPTIRND
jgi:hypothetical protein